MEIWIGCFIGFLCVIICLLGIKIIVMRKSVQEITEAFAERLRMETNILIDISSHDRYLRRLAEDINVQLRKLRRERLRYQQGNLEIMDAITNISHDLRTPLTAVCGYLDLLKQTKQSPEAVRYLEIMEGRIEALKQMIEELFGYSAAVTATRETSFEEVALDSALEEVLSAYYAVLVSRQITPKITMPETKVVRFLNRSALSRILGNIISNAIKYSDGDLRISLTENGEFVFENHAASLDELQVLRLFERFYTVETAAKSTGLGLSIAKELTEQMNGTITAQYQEGILQICICFPDMRCFS